MKLIFRSHALERMFERHIQVADVRQVLLTGETIEKYPADPHYTSRLILGGCQPRPIHVVAAYNDLYDETVIVTVYEPDQARWSAGFRQRLS